MTPKRWRIGIAVACVIILTSFGLRYLLRSRIAAHDVRMATEKNKRSAEDEKLLQRIFDELKSRITADPYGKDGEYARQLSGLPRGLKAMAATHWLDVSLTMDDIGWHFLNFGEPGHVAETESGLRELGLEEMAETFHQTHKIVAPLLSQIANGEDYNKVLAESGHESRIDELSKRAWALQEERDIYSAWLDYAKRHPDQVFGK